MPLITDTQAAAIIGEISYKAHNIVHAYSDRFENPEVYRPIEELAGRVQRGVVYRGVELLNEAINKEMNVEIEDLGTRTTVFSFEQVDVPERGSGWLITFSNWSLTNVPSVVAWEIEGRAARCGVRKIGPVFLLSWKG